MKSTVTSRGQTVVPSELRKRYRIEPGSSLQWLDKGNEIRVIPVPKDVIAALRGSGKGEGLLDALLRERKKDRRREAR